MDNTNTQTDKAREQVSIWKWKLQHDYFRYATPCWKRGKQ